MGQMTMIGWLALLLVATILIAAVVYGVTKTLSMRREAAADDINTPGGSDV